MFKVACVQLTSGCGLEKNLSQAAEWVARARASGADLVMLPENVALMDSGRENLVMGIFAEEDHPALRAFRETARREKVWLQSGSIMVRGALGEVFNRAHLIAPNGEVVARYDKIHLFDVDLGGGEAYRESSTFAAGAGAVVASTPWGRLGMSICYDLRFGALYRALAHAGADFLAVPAAFTRTTGKAHWHVLLRARAIETGCYVFASAQCGRHENGRETFGHALIVNPWGEVLADAGEEPGLVFAGIDPVQVSEARKRLPVLRNEREFRVGHGSV